MAAVAQAVAVMEFEAFLGASRWEYTRMNRCSSMLSLGNRLVHPDTRQIYDKITQISYLRGVGQLVLASDG